MANQPTETSPHTDEATANETQSDSHLLPVEQSAADGQQTGNRPDAESTENALTAAAGQPQRPAQAASKPAVEVRIGSQRDPANKLLAPSKPKAVREAMAAPVNLAQPAPQKSQQPAAKPETEQQAAVTQTNAPAPAQRDTSVPVAQSPVPVAQSPAPVAQAPASVAQVSAPVQPVPVQPAPVQPVPVQPVPVQPVPVQPVPVQPVPVQPAPVDHVPAKAESEATANVDSDVTPMPTVTVDQLSSQWESDAGELDQISMDDLMNSNTVKEIVDEIPLESRIKGTVSRIHRDDVFFLLKGQHEGVASLRQFKKPPEPGMMTDVIVTGYNAEDSLYALSIPGAAVSVADWSDINEGAIVEAKITGSNTGGLECMVNNIRGFIPASQISRFRVENLGEYINQKLTCVVTEANPNRRNLVLSHRAVMERENEEKRQQLLQSLEVGNVYDGTVTKLMDFGVFVDIGGIEGLVHISKLAWDRVQHPKDIIEEGQKIKVKVEKIHVETGKIALSHRDTLEHPWDNIETKYPVGATVKGTVSRLANFGAFVKLESGIEGLIHISELAHSRVQSVKSVLNEGDVVDVKVLSVDREAQKIGLSLKELQPKPEPQIEQKDEEPAEEVKPVVKKRKKPLKGGTSGNSGGDLFGLKW